MPDRTRTATVAGDGTAIIRVTIEWAGCTPGSLAKALVTYDVGGR